MIVHVALHHGHSHMAISPFEAAEARPTAMVTLFSIAHGKTPKPM
jgi:hypothetical protein